MKNILLVFLGLLFVANFIFSETITDTTTILSSVKIENESYYSPYPAEPGQYVDVWLRIRQSGSVANAENVVCRVDLVFPFSIDSSESPEKNIGTLGSGELVLLKYKLKVSPDALEGNNEIEFRCRADGEPWYSATLSIYVQTHNPVLSITEVEIQPQAFLPGENGIVKLTIKNHGESTLKDISIAMNISSSSIPFAPLNDVNEKRVKQLAKDEDTELEFKIWASPAAEVDVYKIPMNITYSDLLGNDYEKEEYISIAIDAEPVLFFALESTTLNKKATKGRVSISLANKGLSKIKFTTVKLLASTDYSIVSTNEKYVGDLDPDDSSSAEFEVYTNTTKNKIDLPFELSYVDGFGRTHMKNATISLPIYTQDDAITLGLEKKQDNGVWYFIGGGAVLLMILWQALKLLRKNGK